MSLQQLYSWAKKIHKLVMWVVVVLGIWMMISGYFMHQELEGDRLLSVDMEFVRYWHNEVSQYFLVALLAQMVSGLAIWAVPKLLQRRAA